MNCIKYISIFISFSLLAQEKISVKYISEFPLKVDEVVRIDNFSNMYWVDDNTFVKQAENNKFIYNNMQLGQISSVNAFNPLKITLFYKNFNTIVILDNRLAEITKIDFNAIQPLRIISNVTSANDNAIWIFNDLTRQLELYDFINNKTKVTTLPVEGDILSITSNYNYFWVLTDEFIYTYNYFGSLLSKMPNKGFSQLATSNDNLFLKKENKLFYQSKENSLFIEIDLPELLIKQFFVTNESLYIYNGESLHKYQLIND